LHNFPAGHYQTRISSGSAECPLLALTAFVRPRVPELRVLRQRWPRRVMQPSRALQICMLSWTFPGTWPPSCRKPQPREVLHWLLRARDRNQVDSLHLTYHTHLHFTELPASISAGRADRTRPRRRSVPLGRRAARRLLNVNPSVQARAVLADRLWQCALTARIISGGGFHPDNCR